MKTISKLFAGLVLASAVALVATLAPATAGTHGHDRSHGHAVYYGPKWYHHTIHSRASARHYLPGASRGFQHYAAHQGAKLRRAAIRSGASHTCVQRSGVQVQRFQTRGFAYGAIGGCGGAIALWKRIDGHWRHIVVTQDVIYCSTLRTYAVPASVVRNGTRHATCFNRQQNAEVRYRHG